MASHVADGKGRVRRYSLDDSVLQEMGYAPRTPFDEGIKATVRWYEENRAWWEPLKRSPDTAGPAGEDAQAAATARAAAAAAPCLTGWSPAQAACLARTWCLCS